MIAATTTKPSAGCEAVARENPVVKPKNVKRSGDLGKKYNFLSFAFEYGQRITFCGQILAIRTQWHKWWNSLEMRILQLIYNVGLRSNSYLNNYPYLSHEEFKKEYLGLKTDIERGDDERSYQEFAYKDVDVEALPNLLTGERKEPRLLR
ncbi:hypothetical protein Bca52824_035996 [Brassica carinata]|uniref:Uncharacterized protein n=1 Tax=Brassica carinata TaxID=52824 RepID=A0A8X7S352_BRACI|nr:hypothetical protein Bca52824_035996 [Brassica carinata]